jgi:hypothetical protein
MNTSSPFLSVDGTCEKTVRWLNERLTTAGLRVLQTFDLHEARLAVGDCPCPHHGTAECDCQMVVQLVYDGGAQPVTMMLHTYDGRTWLSLVDTPGQKAELPIRAAILKALQVNLFKEGL